MQLRAVNSKEFSVAGAGEVPKAPGDRGRGENVPVSVACEESPMLPCAGNK